MVGGQRLRVGDVQTGREDRDASQRRGQGTLIDNWSARGVDKHRRRLHLCKLTCTEQALRLRVQIRVDRNEVALSQKRVEVDARCLQLALDVRSLDLVCVEHLHSPTKVKLASDGVADPSHPDDAERATDEVLAEPAQWIP